MTAAVHREGKKVKTEGWKIRRARGGRRRRGGGGKLRNRKSPKTDALRGERKMEEMKAEAGRVMVGIERMRAIPPRRRESPRSGPTQDCQGPNDITLHVIYFTAPGWVHQVPEDAYNPDCCSQVVAAADPQTQSPGAPGREVANSLLHWFA